ncbi:unnamed protein product, partial [Ostreobium quekettii]
MAMRWLPCVRLCIPLLLAIVVVGKMTLADTGAKEPRGNKDGDQLSLAWLQPMAVSMGVSGGAGLAVGATLKLISRTLAVAAGVVIIAVQVLVWQDLIEVKWANVESKLRPYVDVDGDGVLTEMDVRHLFEQGVGVLSQ